MILPNSDINIMDIRNVTGCPSTDLGTLCAKAKFGGEGGYAFKIVENGYQNTQGNLLENAQPYWNIFSNNSPGEWHVSGAGEVAFKLKRSPDYPTRYCYSLGNFRGYNSNAAETYIKDTLVRVPTGLLSRAIVHACPSEYDWRKIDPSITQIGLIDADTGAIVGEPKAYAPTNNSVPFTVNIQTTSPYTKRLRLAPMNKFGDYSFRLPNYGELEVLIQGRTTARILVNSPYGGSVSKIEELTSMAFDRLSLQVLRRPNCRPFPTTLREVRYTISNENNEIVFNKTRTNTYPGKETVNFDWVDVGIGSYTYVAIYVEDDVKAALKPYDYNLTIEAVYK